MVAKTLARKTKASAKGIGRRKRVKIEEISFTQLDTLTPAPKGTVRIVQYGSADGRVGRPRKEVNPFGLAR